MGWFKQHFVPNEGNDYRPHLLEEISAAGILFAALSLFTMAVAGGIILSRTNLTALVLPKVLVDYANEDRAEKNFSGLTINPVLEKAAQLKANDMAEKSYFAHKSPDGKTPWYWFQKAGYDFSYAGENLAVNFNDSVDVNSAWMNSPSHRDNILNENFSEIGIATAEGVYEGHPTVYVVELFGRPAETKPLMQNNVVGAVSVTKPAVHNQNVLAVSAVGQSKVSTGTSELLLSVGKGKDESALVSIPTYSSAIERFLTSPSKDLSFAYMIIGSLILLCLFIMTFYEYRRHHYRIMALGLALVLVLLGLSFVYHNLIFSPILLA